MSNVFIAFQRVDETRELVEAIVADNPGAVVTEQPAMVKIDRPESMTIKRRTIEEKLGRAYDLQEMQIFLITLSGNIDETDDEFNLRWKQ